MNLTLIDFAVIIGFQCIGVLLEFLVELATNKDFIKVFLGFLPSLKKCGVVYISYLMGHLFGQSREYHVFISG